MDIDTLKTWLDESQYWWVAISFILGATGSILFRIKRTSNWLICLVKWLHSIWPYTTIRKQKEEIAQLKREQFITEEVIILQLSWAVGAENYINTSLVSDALKCDSQKAQHVLDKLCRKNLILVHPFNTGVEYSMTQHGRAYIVNNNLEISLDRFNIRMKGGNDANQLVKEPK